MLACTFLDHGKILLCNVLGRYLSDAVSKQILRGQFLGTASACNAQHRPRLEKLKKNLRFPCETPQALEAFEALSAPHVRSATCKWVGQWAKRCGLFRSDEFKAAKDRLQAWPQAKWQHTTFTYSGAMGSVQFHYKNIVIEDASIFCGAAHST